MSRPKEWMPHQAACGQCGNRFETERHVDGRVKRHLCSQSCAAAAAQAFRRGGRTTSPVWKTCEVCTLKFEARTSYQVNKQRCCSRVCFLKLLPSYRRKPKISVTCGQCGVVVMRSQSQVEGRDMLFCSLECRGIWQTQNGVQAGENNGQWKGGSTTYWKQKARERDDFTCQVDGCDVKDEGNRTHAHHKLPRRAGGSDELSNLITLCNKHHQTLEQQLYDMFMERHPDLVAEIVREMYTPG